MLFSYYKETPLEQWINTKFLARGIMTTINHDIERIAEAFEVALVYDICPSFSDNEDGVIFLNKHADDVTARVIFFHELCHVLRHAGDQRNMSVLFKSAQEIEADQFVLYAAIPFYLVAKLNIPDQRNEAIPYLADKFHVPLSLAEQRLDQIQRRVLQGSLIAAAQEASKRQRQQKQQEPMWTNETHRVLAQLSHQLSGKEAL
ncbi:Zn-dependent peptidase ImmA (M78 family) [Paenibacillus anaericanus]|uniref:ImmA/IrrE family metallo-endopeptidase n=1 Tax=Paenibacillus anaericanus TaxID=170367 RepID=A0A433Y9B2_9BACL|nr:ImmA/IrrE family metallo-endopeptidase [Paenibacillus anaericanus]MDQ0090177.1 Zn-dependent peptidase ImmA (M78 family) [Paenibacillus anaericanus]RUT46426.1 ImmA/IrrE family metallo-endopeptidase [Paenibacillus anaericanus]